MMQLPGLGQRIDPDEAARVRGLVQAVIADDDVTVMVTELACTEPGCPPRETVIALMRPGAPRQHKIHKPLAEVTAADVATMLVERGDHDHH